MSATSETISVTIVSYNSDVYIERCLESVFAQDWPSIEIIVIDNASSDQTCSLLEKYKGRIQVVLNAENRGFAAGQNQAIHLAKGEWIFALNPDVRLEPNFLSLLLQEKNLDPKIGTICGKLLRANSDLLPTLDRRIDSAGIYFTPTFRHLDRGSDLPDSPEYDEPAYVFGATAAAALYSKALIEDVSVDGEFFDEDFFLYREDADVSWRAQLQGWRCLYLPQAVGYHVRTAFPTSRRELPPSVNRQAVLNRFLMRIKNATLFVYLRNFIPVTFRDFGAIFYCFTIEHSSLSAFPSALRQWRRMSEKRRIIQSRRRVSEEYLLRWFRFRPVTIPVHLSSASISVSPSSASPRPAVSVPSTESRPLRSL
jgi:GT2 family glycosyltransferase